MQEGWCVVSLNTKDYRNVTRLSLRMMMQCCLKNVMLTLKEQQKIQTYSHSFCEDLK